MSATSLRKARLDELTHTLKQDISARDYDGGVVIHGR
jgi:L-asparaginase/Glu-tRNA(Gln) amidotransferase subunit D